jgi:hypothetical protein
VHDLAPGSFLNVFKVVRAVFKKFGAGPVFWGGLTTLGGQIQRGGLTAQGMRCNRPGQSEQVFALCCIPTLHYCFGSGGACICAGGVLCVVRALGWWFVLFA